MIPILPRLEYDRIILLSIAALISVSVLPAAAITPDSSAPTTTSAQTTAPSSALALRGIEIMDSDAAMRRAIDQGLRDAVTKTSDSARIQIRFDRRESSEKYAPNVAPRESVSGYDIRISDSRTSESNILRLDAHTGRKRRE